MELILSTAMLNSFGKHIWSFNAQTLKPFADTLGILLLFCFVHFPIDYEQSLFPLRDSRKKRTSEQARTSPAALKRDARVEWADTLAAQHVRRVSTRQAKFAPARLFVSFDYAWAERETTRSLFSQQVGNILKSIYLRFCSKLICHAILHSYIMSLNRFYNVTESLI